MEPDIKDKPINKIPKPSAIIPTFLLDSFFTNITKIIPIIKAIGARVSGLKNAPRRFLPIQCASARN